MTTLFYTSIGVYIYSIGVISFFCVFNVKNSPNKEKPTVWISRCVQIWLVLYVPFIRGTTCLMGYMIKECWALMIDMEYVIDVITVHPGCTVNLNGTTSE